MNRVLLASLALPLLLSGLSSTGAAPRYQHIARPAAPAAPKTPAELTAAVRKLLDGYEPLDVEHGMSQLGAPAADVLLRLIHDPGTLALTRLRAIEALGYVPTPAGQSYLRELITQIGSANDERVFTLAAAVRALGAFGPGELVSLAPLLGHGSADVREAATASLAKMKSDSVLPALKERLAVERDSGVKASLNNAIRRLASTTRP